MCFHVASTVFAVRSIMLHTANTVEMHNSYRCCYEEGVDMGGE